jgi:phosphatidylinositol dimannoside acyltransferase
MKLRDVLTWKFAFYQGLLPSLRALGPARADAALTALGRASTSLWAPRRWKLASTLSAIRAGVRSGAADWDDDALAPELAVGCLRFLARDYLLETHNDAQALALFDTTGGDALMSALRDGRGVVLVGSHFGAHLAAFHWLYRKQAPLRLMVQRPRHVSRALERFFDRDEPEPQADFFLTRRMEPPSCVSRILAARGALRAGKAVYLAGDIPWTGPNARPCRFLGQTRRLLSVWADLAANTGAPVFYVFCGHQPGGRFTLALEPAGQVAAGGEQAAVNHYLSRLEATIVANPSDAVAHALWPCYGHVAPTTTAATTRPSRRAAALPFSG